MKKLSSKQVLQKLKEYLMICIAGALNAVSLYIFVNPATIIAGGFSGLSSALSYVFVRIVNLDFDTLMSVIYFALNVPLLICALILLRGDFTIKTILSTVVCTLVLRFMPQELKFHSAENARLISTILGGIIIGISMHLASEYNGSNGGTEVIARIVSKYHPEIDLSTVILTANFAVTFAGSIVVMIYENQTVAVILYSFIYVIVGGNFMGMLKRGFNHPQKFLIVTTNFDELGKAINSRFRRGFSVVDVENSYDGKERKIISVIVQYRQMPELKQIIRKYDPEAFTVVKEVYDVFSRPGFNRSYK